MECGEKSQKFVMVSEVVSPDAAASRLFSWKNTCSRVNAR
jgi:hypothetical protein